MKPSKLFKKTLLLFIGLFGVLTVAISVFTAIMVYESVLQEHRTRAFAIARTISSSGLDVLLNQDATSIQSFIDQVIEIQGISYAFYESAEGGIVAHTFVPRIPASVSALLSATPGRDLQNQEQSGSYLTRTMEIPGQGTFLDVAAPILSGAAGFIHIGMDMKLVQKSIWKILSRIQLLTLAIFAITVAIAYFLVEKISHPLSELTVFAERMAAHDFDANIAIDTDDEVGLLARNMKTMGRELSTLVSGLEQSVHSATTELQSTLSSMTVILDNIAEGLVVTDGTGTILRHNPQVTGMFGLAAESIVGKNIRLLLGKTLDTILAEDGTEESGSTPLDRFMDSPKTYPSRVIEFAARRADGTEIPVEISISTIGTRAETSYVAMIRDITLRKRAEKEQQRVQELLERSVRDRTLELSEANALLRLEIQERKSIELALASEKELLGTTLRSIGDGVITTDTNGRIVLMNKVAENLTGWTQNAARGKDFAEVYKILKPARANGPSRAEPNLLEKDVVLISRNGKEVDVAQSVSPIMDQKNQILGAVLVFRDVTSQKKQEVEHLKSEKLGSLGILAGGIAHDFNNILTAILNNISMARIMAKGDERATANLKKAESATLRAQKLTNQLLTFSQGGEPIKEIASIAELIKESANFALRGTNIKCEYEIDSDIWPVEVDHGQIVQVLDNLIVNAVQAMPKGGTITITARNMDPKPGEAQPLLTGKCVVITVKDQGHGIDPGIIEKIFDPYFTTKDKGSGLGLATTYSIVKSHNGRIDVSSTSGSGTVFTIHLPASPEQGVPVTQPSQNVLIRGKGNILVMDDEESLRNVLEDTLCYLGYSPVFAVDGREALEIYRESLENGKSIDAVIMDLTIPGGMGGKETIRELLLLDPQARAIVSSGYSNDPVMANFRRFGFKDVLLKPYTMEEISTKLQTLLCPV
jgi:PAS domain S-box-containing protein